MQGLQFIADLCPCRAGAVVHVWLTMNHLRGHRLHGAAVPRYIDGPQAAR